DVLLGAVAIREQVLEQGLLPGPEEPERPPEPGGHDQGNAAGVVARVVEPLGLPVRGDHGLVATPARVEPWQAGPPADRVRVVGPIAVGAGEPTAEVGRQRRRAGEYDP